MSTHAPCDPPLGIEEAPAIDAFVDKFLLGANGVNTDYWLAPGAYPPNDNAWRTWYGLTFTGE